MASKKRTVAACVRDIRRINARFRKRQDIDEAETDRLMTEKDRLIDEMAGLCSHPSAIATRGSRRKGGPAVRPRRICTSCGFCEALWQQDRFRALVRGKITFLPHDEYVIQEGLILKKLGINI